MALHPTPPDGFTEESTVFTQKHPSWLSWTNLTAGIYVATVVAGLGMWAMTETNKTDNTSLAIISIDSRLNIISARTESIAVMVEQINEARAAIALAAGNYASLDVRLRAMENNMAANHNDILHAEGRK